MTLDNCKRCLLSDLDKDEYFKSIFDYIASLPEEIKASGEIYEQRLSICRKCDSLVNGMCRLCGCFVEVRAAKKFNYCAKDKTVW